MISVLGAAGVLLTVAGQNAIDSIYPNFSIFWYWSKTDRVIMRKRFRWRCGACRRGRALLA